MRTRRSPRNQDRLWKALGGEKIELPRPRTLTRDDLSKLAESPLLSPRTREHYRRQLSALDRFEYQRARVRAALDQENEQ